MTIPPGGNLYTQGFGSRPENVEVPHIDTRAPTTTDILYPVGKRWINTSSNTDYTLTSFSSSGGTLTANWTLLGTNTGALNTLSDGTTTVNPTAGNIEILGTASQITSTGTNGPGAITLSLPTTMVVPGSLEVTGLLKGDAGATLNTAGTAINIATDSDTAAVNISTVGARTTTIGDITGASAMVLHFGTGNCVISGVAASTITIGAAAQTGAINIGVSSAIDTINVGTGAGASVLNFGSSAAGNITSTISSGSTYSIVGSGGTIDIGNDATSNVINIGSSSCGNITITEASGSTFALVGSGATINLAADAAANLVTLGSTTGVASTTIKGGTGGIVITPTGGKISMAPGTASTSSASPTLSDRLGSITFTGFTTASGSSQVFTITNTNVLTTSAVFVTVTNLDASGNHAEMTLISCRLSANTLTIDTKNNGAGALGAGDNVLINFWVMS